MPWWAWVLVGLGTLVLLGVGWVVVIIYLMSKGDATGN